MGRLEEADLEGTSAYAILRAGLEVSDPVDPRAIAYGLRVRVVYGSLRGCGGMLVANDPPTIVLRYRGTDVDRAMRLAHELGHWALALTGTLDAHDERDVDEIAWRILVPSGFVRVACLAQGLTVDELPALCPLVPLRIVIARARHVLGLDVATDERAA